MEHTTTTKDSENATPTPQGHVTRKGQATRTYSVTIQSKDGHWITNWHKYFDLSEIDWSEVKAFCKGQGSLAYGYQYGTRSNEQTSRKTRKVLWIRLPGPAMGLSPEIANMHGNPLTQTKL